MRKSKVVKKVKSKSSALPKRIKKYDEGGIQGLKKNTNFDPVVPGKTLQKTGKKTLFGKEKTEVINIPTAPKTEVTEMKLKSEPTKNIPERIVANFPTIDQPTGPLASSPVVSSPVVSKPSVPKANLLPGGFTSEAQKAAYIKSVKDRMSNGATLDQLVKDKVGTKAGLQGLGFKDSAVKAPVKTPVKNSAVKAPVKNSAVTTPAKTKVYAGKSYSGKTNIYTNKKGIKTAEKLTMKGGKSTFTRVVTDKSGKKTTYVKSGDKKYLKTADGKVKTLKSEKLNAKDQKVEDKRLAEIAKGPIKETLRERERKQALWNAKSSDGRGEVDEFWQLPIGGGVGSKVVTSGVKLVGKTLFKKAGNKITTDLANIAARNATAVPIKVGKYEIAFLKSQAAKQASKLKQLADNAVGTMTKLTKEKIGQQFAKNLSQKGTQKLLGASKNSVGNTAKLTKEKIGQQFAKNLSQKGTQKLLGAGRTVSSGSQKALQQGSKISKSTAAKVNQVAKNRSTARVAKNSKIESSIVTNNSVARKMAKQTKLEDLAKAGAKRVKTSVKNTKIKNAKPKPGDQTKLNLRRGGKI